MNNELPTISYASRLSSLICHPIMTYELRTTNYQLNTSDERSIFMQNKPNFPDDQMNVTSCYTVDYEDMSNCKRGQNKPNSKPIKPNSQNTQMNVNIVSTKYYENMLNLTLFENKANINQIQSQFQTAHLLIDRNRPEFLNFLLKKPLIPKIAYKARATLCRFVYKIISLNLSREKAIINDDFHLMV